MAFIMTSCPLVRQVARAVEIPSFVFLFLIIKNVSLYKTECYMKTEQVKLTKLKVNSENPRTITKDKFDKLINSILVFPRMLEIRPIVVDGEYTALGGNQRTEALKAIAKMEIGGIADRLTEVADFQRMSKAEQEDLIRYWDAWLLGEKKVSVIKADELTDDERKQFIIKDNAGFGDWDWDMLANSWDADLLTDWGLDLPGDWGESNDKLSSENSKLKLESKSLTDKFIIPPFSILDTKMGYWQNRKKEWLSLGIKSEIGRTEELTYSKSCQSPAIYEVKNYLREKNGKEPNWDEVLEYCNKNGIAVQNGTSIFDPVLCEVSYRWFCTDNGKILDPFAGGSVRGIVASKLGYVYEGNDLRQEQVDANIDNAKEILKDNLPLWTCGDSNDIDKLKKGQEYDMIFSCPPYADLEVYSDNEKDLSTMDYPHFLEVYKNIISKCCSLLKNNRFAVFVVGEVRGKKGEYYDFVSDTIRAFLDAGMLYYNEIILANNISSVAMKVSKQFNSSREIGKVHQNVLVFYKGDIKNIKKNYKELDFSDVDDMIGGESNG